MAPTPPLAPAEAPKITSVKELHDKKADTLRYLQDMEGLGEGDKKNFAAEYEAALKSLESKTDEDKQKDIGNIKTELESLKTAISNEKKDENEDFDEKVDDNTADVQKQKLNVEKEIRGHLDAFKKNIENKLTAPAATPESPKEDVPPAITGDIQEAKEFFANKGVKIDTAPAQKGNFLTNFFKKIVLQFYNFLEGFGMDVRGAKAKLEGYKDYTSKQKVEETFKVLGEYMGDSINGITDIKDKEALIGKMEGLGLPLLQGDNLLAGPIMKIIFTGDENAWNDLPENEDFDHDILKAIRGKYLTLKDKPKALGGMNTLQKLKEIFTIEEGEEKDYILRYEDDQEAKDAAKHKPVIEPVKILTEAEKRAEEEKQKISELEKAEKADKNLSEALGKYPTGNPELIEAQESVDATKNKSRERIWNALKNAETERDTAKTELIVAQSNLDAAQRLYNTNKSLENEQKKNAAEEKVKDITQLQTNAEKAIQAITDIAKNLAGGTLPPKIEDWKILGDKTASEGLLGAQKSESEIKSMHELLGENKDASKREKEEKEQGAANKLNPFTESNIVIFNNKPYQWTGTNEFREIHYKVGGAEGERIGRNSWWTTGDVVIDSEAIKKVKVLTFSDAEKIFHGGYMDKENKNGISINNDGYIWIKNTEGPEFRDPK